MRKNMIFAITVAVILIAAGTVYVFSTSNNDKNESDADRTFVDSYGLEFTVPANIETSVIQSGPPLTFASYLGPSVVSTIIATGNDVKHAGGLNTYSAYYDLTEVATITQSSFTTTEAEKIIALDPDIVIVAGGSSISDTVVEFSEKMKNAGIGCCVLMSVSDVTDSQFQTQLRFLADVFNVEDRANELIEQSLKYVSDLEKRLSSVKTTDVKYVFAAGINWGGADGFFKSTSEYTPFIYLGDKVVNVYSEITSVGTSTLDKEQLYQYEKNVHSIDMIFIDTGSGYSGVLSQYDSNPSVFNALSAFEDKEVYSVLPWCFRGMMPDNSIIIAYQIANLLYPELFENFDFDKLAQDIWSLFMGADDAGEIVYDIQKEYVNTTLGVDKDFLDKSPLVDA
jgi:iron complex transport system substrate-binding protein